MVDDVQALDGCSLLFEAFAWAWSIIIIIVRSSISVIIAIMLIAIAIAISIICLVSGHYCTIAVDGAVGRCEIDGKGAGIALLLLTVLLTLLWDT